MTIDAAPTPVAETQTETNARVARATGVLALGNITSRILGLAREVVLTNLFGATGASDAFRVAVIVPKALYDLLIGGHVNSAIIPILSEVVTTKGRDELWRLVSVLLTLSTALMAVLVLGLEIFAPQIIHVVGGGYDESTLALMAHLLRLTAPALIFLSLFAVLSGTLYALRVFNWPAFAGVVFNASIVIVALVFAPPPQVQAVLDTNGMMTWRNARPAEGVVVVALGWLIGALVQLALQFPGLRGMRLSIRWRHPAIRRIVALYTPVMFSLILDTLVIRTFSYNLASQTGEGSISYMDLATTLIQFPQGLIATAISIAILPTLARQAALTSDDNPGAFHDTLGLGLRLAVTMILPAAVGLFVLAAPIVQLLFEHGAFTVGDTAMTVLALRLYLIGLPFAALDLLLVYAFYARQDTLTPALIGLLSLTIYMIVAVMLFPRYGLFSLMIADSMKHIVHALTSALLLRRRVGGLGDQRLLLTIGKAVLAALAMGIVAQQVMPNLQALIGTRTVIQEGLFVTIIGSVSVCVYLLAAVLLRIEELRWLFSLIRQHISRPANEA